MQQTGSNAALRLIQNGRMRKPVVFITGAGGEIGHGLIDRLAASGRRRSSRSTSRRSMRRSRRQVQREFIGSILDSGAARTDPGGVRSRSRLPPGRAALHALGVHADRARTRSTSRARSRCSSSRRRRPSRTAAPSCFLYPSSIAAYGLPDLGTKSARRTGARGRIQPSDDDVRREQAVLRAARDATTRGTTSSWPPNR